MFDIHAEEIVAAWSWTGPLIDRRAESGRLAEWHKLAEERTRCAGGLRLRRDRRSFSGRRLSDDGGKQSISGSFTQGAIR